MHASEKLLWLLNYCATNDAISILYTYREFWHVVYIQWHTTFSHVFCVCTKKTKKIKNKINSLSCLSSAQYQNSKNTITQKVLANNNNNSNHSHAYEANLSLVYKLRTKRMVLLKRNMKICERPKSWKKKLIVTVVVCFDHMT